MQHWLQELISFSNGTLDLRVCYYSGMEVKIRKDMNRAKLKEQSRLAKLGAQV
jgi:hypothetical protein